MLKKQSKARKQAVKQTDKKSYKNLDDSIVRKNRTISNYLKEIIVPTLPETFEQICSNSKAYHSAINNARLKFPRAKQVVFICVVSGCYLQINLRGAA